MPRKSRHEREVDAATVNMTVMLDGMSFNVTKIITDLRCEPKAHFDPKDVAEAKAEPTKGWITLEDMILDREHRDNQIRQALTELGEAVIKSLHVREGW